MNKERVFKLVYDLLDEYDIEIWEDIQYIDLANFWVEMIRETSKKSNDLIKLEKIREDLLYEYLFKGEERNIKKIDKLQQQLADIKFYIEQSNIKDMLWGKEILEIIEKN